MDYGMNLIGLHNGNKLYGLEGWASFTRQPLGETARNERRQLK
jgi:hypothetical protein